MIVEVLGIEGCANVEPAAQRVRRALERTGHPAAAVEIRRVRSRVDAASTPFAGSPTIALDGVDLFPSDGPVLDLACRVYLTPDGIAGMPTVEQIVERLAAR